MNREQRNGRRGSAYILVLGIAMLVTVLGMGALAVTRVAARATNDGNDWETAGTLAFSATEHAVSVINAAAAASPNTWRSTYTNGETAFTQTVGRGQFSWSLKDEIDGSLSDDYLARFRVYGVGRVGSVTRVYSVQLAPAGPALDVLRTVMHSSNSLDLNGQAESVGGPFSTDGKADLSGTVNGSLECASIKGTANGTRTVTTGVPAKVLPSPTLINELGVYATPINYTAIPLGTIQKCLLSPASNPYGAINAKGVYSVALPAGKTLTISSCRIVGTLLVSGTSGNTITVNGPVSWETGPANGPLLLVSSPGVAVTINGSPTWLSEATVGVNLNPPSTPFNGASDTDLSDDFPPYLTGIIHVVGGSSGTFNFRANAYVIGTAITDCPLKSDNRFTGFPSAGLQADPPIGYRTADAFAPVGGTWRWDTLP